MKKYLFLILGILSIAYSKQDCIFKDSNVCVYIDKKYLYANMIIENTSKYPITIQDASMTMDGVHKNIKNILLDTEDKIIIIKSRYDREDKIPTYTVGIFDYKKHNTQIIKPKEKGIVGENGHLGIEE